MKLLLILLFLLFPLTSTAGVYKWVDENGNLHFGSKPKPVEPTPEVKVKPSAPVENIQERKAAQPSQDKRSPTPAKALKSSTTAIPHIPPKNTPERQSTPVAKPAPVSASKPPSAKNKTAAESKPVKPIVKKPVTTKTVENKQKPAKAAPKAAPKKKAQTKKTVTKSSAPKPTKKKVAVKKQPKPKSKPKPKPKPAPKPAAPVASATDKDEELCGMFTNYVSDYQNKLIDCQDASCAIYEKSLLKYQKKQKAYCN